MAAFRRGLEVYEGLVGEDPKDLTHIMLLNWRRTELGKMLTQRNDREGALKLYTQAIDQLEAAFSRDPHYASIASALATARGARAAVLVLMQHHPDAVKDLNRALELATSDKDRNRCQLARRVAVMGAVHRQSQLELSRRGDHETAMAEADALAGCEGVPSNGLYKCACAYALASPIAPDADSREKRAAGALALLRRADAFGHFKTKKHLDELKTDKDLNALRTRDDFKKLLAELEAK